MARVSSGPASRQRRKKWLKLAKGYVGGRSRLYRSARDTVERALAYAYRDRKAKKRAFRRLWIIRINAGARQHGLSYSRLIGALAKANVQLDRKVLAGLAAQDPAVFSAVVDIAKTADS